MFLYLRLKYFLIILDLFPGQLGELCVDGSFNEPGLHLRTAVDGVIYLISSVENCGQFVISRHDRHEIQVTSLTFLLF